VEVGAIRGVGHGFTSSIGAGQEQAVAQGSLAGRVTQRLWGPLEVGLGLGKGRAKTIPDLVFELFPVLKQMLRRRGGDLSGGQQQQLAIGRALVLQPSLLILDEPTEGIQPNIVHEIGDIILRLNRDAGVTVLLVEQKLPFARRIASEFRILEKGRCVADGPIEALTDTVVRNHLSV